MHREISLCCRTDSSAHAPLHNSRQMHTKPAAQSFENAFFGQALAFCDAIQLISIALRSQCWAMQASYRK